MQEGIQPPLGGLPGLPGPGFPPKATEGVALGPLDVVVGLSGLPGPGLPPPVAEGDALGAVDGLMGGSGLPGPGLPPNEPEGGALGPLVGARMGTVGRTVSVAMLGERIGKSVGE